MPNLILIKHPYFSLNRIHTMANMCWETQIWIICKCTKARLTRNFCQQKGEEFHANINYRLTIDFNSRNFPVRRSFVQRRQKSVSATRTQVPRILAVTTDTLLSLCTKIKRGLNTVHNANTCRRASSPVNVPENPASHSNKPDVTSAW